MGAKKDSEIKGAKKYGEYLLNTLFNALFYLPVVCETCWVFHTNSQGYITGGRAPG